MTQATSAEQQFLMGGESVPSIFSKEDPVGTRRGGPITDQPVLRQQSDFDTGALLYWDNGDKRMHLVVTVQTDQRDPQNADDDGRRRFYIKGNLQGAVRDAVKKSGAPGLEIGGSLYVTRVGRDEPKRRGVDGAWLYSAEYVPAAANFVAQPAAQAPQAAAPAPVAAAPQAPAQNDGASELEAELAKLPVDQAAALRGVPGMTAAGIRAMNTQV